MFQETSVRAMPARAARPPYGSNMRPTEVLTQEHRVIEQVLDCIETLAERARSGHGLDAVRAERALEVVRSFADRCHHGKEEDRLFPMLVARGMSTQFGPVAVMLDEHRLGRELVRRMGEACAANDPAGFAEAAAGYVRLLREHIAKEDGVLFPMAESILDAAAREALLESFRSFERDGLEPGVRERCLRMADDLALSLGVPRAAERGPAATSPSPCQGFACP